MENRCEICLDPACGGARNCNCEACDKAATCYRTLKPIIRLTRKCTQSCSHCCYECSPACNDMMSLEVGRDVGRFVRANGIRYGEVLGGEFYLNPYWAGIMDEFVPVMRSVRLVTNGDWAGDPAVAGEVVAYLVKNPQVYVAISRDRWHHNRHVDEAVRYCEERGIPHQVQTEEQGKPDANVPVGRSYYDYGHYSAFSYYCGNPEKRYSFLVDERGDIFKCGFGTWNYATIQEYTDGGFRERFKEFGEKFYSCFISNCRSCVTMYNRALRDKKISKTAKAA